MIPNTIIVRIEPFTRVQWEGIIRIRYAVIVIIRIGVVPYPVLIRIQGL